MTRPGFTSGPSKTLENGLAHRLEAVRTRIRAAASRAGRAERDIRLVAVTKAVDATRIPAAWSLGLRDFGENRVQEALAKMEALTKLDALGEGIRWHLIGSLQRNKVARAIRHFTLIHSVDSDGLVDEIARRSQAAGRQVEILLQVNVAGEARKHGYAPDRILDAARRIGTRSGVRGVRLRGLMTMAPLADDPDDVRPMFRRLRALGETLQQVIPEATELSMGMSDDFDVAVEEGATIVRVGRALFGTAEQSAAPFGGITN